MPCRVLRKWQENLPEAHFVNQYGPTEATASCTYYSVDHTVEDDEVLPIGKAYDNYRVFLIDEHGNEPAVGKQGEICVCGPILALGYYNDPERTAAAFTLNPLNRLILSGCTAQGITEGSMRTAYFISVDVWTAR